jgi:hypothetical protein
VSGTSAAPLSLTMIEVDKEEIMHDNIREHMDVIGSDGKKVGTVDHIQGSEIKLTKSADAEGKHHLIPLGWVAKVDAHVHLSKAANDVKAQWKAAA